MSNGFFGFSVSYARFLGIVTIRLTFLQFRRAGGKIGRIAFVETRSKNVRRVIALLLMLCLPLTVLADAMDDYARTRFRVRDVVGGAVVIALNGEIVYGYDYGYKNVSKTKPVTLDTCFHAASVTKMVSAIGLMQLLTDLDISLDTPVQEITGFPVENPSFPGQPITVRQVMSHTSSFQQVQYLTPNWENMKVGGSYYSTKNAPGTAYEYSNMNGGLLGAMIEALSGDSVNTYMQRSVFEPLGINAAYHAALLPDTSDLSAKMKKNGTIYRSADKELETFKQYNDVCDPRQNTDITSGSLYISANGLMRIVMMLANGGELDGERILPEETVALMMQEQHLIEGSSVQAESKYGLCISRVEGLPGGTWYGHQGMWQGMTSDAYYQPDTGLCVVVLANGYNANTTDGVVNIARDFMQKAQEFLQ